MKKLTSYFVESVGIHPINPWFKPLERRAWDLLNKGSLKNWHQSIKTALLIIGLEVIDLRNSGVSYV